MTKFVIDITKSDRIVPNVFLYCFTASESSCPAFEGEKRVFNLFNLIFCPILLTEVGNFDHLLIAPIHQ